MQNKSISPSLHSHYQNLHQIYFTGSHDLAMTNVISHVIYIYSDPRD